LYLATLYEEKKDFPQALAYIEKGVEKAPDDPDILFRKGIILDRMGRKDEAIEVMRSILEVDPENANALNYIGYTYAEMGVRLGEAKQLITAALRSNPDDAYILDSLAWVYYKMGQPKKALREILKAIELVPDDPVIHEHLGDVYMGLGNKQKAAEAYQKALDYNHEDADKIREKLQKAR
ncbi:MAG: tetratricopeptide repeat protein, partial [Syntrophobacteraceae bacterium]